MCHCVSLVMDWWTWYGRRHRIQPPLDPKLDKWSRKKMNGNSHFHSFCFRCGPIVVFPSNLGAHFNGLCDEIRVAVTYIITQVPGIPQAKGDHDKDSATVKYLQTLIQMLRDQLNGRNKIPAINPWVLPVIWYIAEIIRAAPDNTEEKELEDYQQKPGWLPVFNSGSLECVRIRKASPKVTNKQKWHMSP